MNIAIIGTRGVPNRYGGFEQFAEYLSQGLKNKGHHVTVYNSHNHPYQRSKWNGIYIIHCYDPEFRFGNMGQFIYDFNCIRDSRKRNFDIILQLGYTSNSIWGWLLPRKKSIVTTNMDGLEWKRRKFSWQVRQFLKIAEKLAVKSSDYLISDSVGIQRYIREKYGKESVYIPYGANLFSSPDPRVLEKYFLFPYGYNMLVARLEPENSIETILDGVILSETSQPFVVVGGNGRAFGHRIKEKFKRYGHIHFLGGIYDIHELNNLRYYSNLYFHGHTVGGTNPSLLEAMASRTVICAHKNVFNQAILGNDAFYFKTKEQVANLILEQSKRKHSDKIAANSEKIATTYAWPEVIDQYLEHFEEILIGRKRSAPDFIPAEFAEEEHVAFFYNNYDDSTLISK